MCRSTADGYRRCNKNANHLADESLRKAEFYAAKKEGLNREEWREKFPEKASALDATYERRVQKFKRKHPDHYDEQDDYVSRGYWGRYAANFFSNKLLKENVARKRANEAQSLADESYEEHLEDVREAEKKLRRDMREERSGRKDALARLLKPVKNPSDYGFNRSAYDEEIADEEGQSEYSKMSEDEKDAMLEQNEGLKYMHPEDRRKAMKEIAQYQKSDDEVLRSPDNSEKQNDIFATPSSFRMDQALAQRRETATVGYSDQTMRNEYGVEANKETGAKAVHRMYAKGNIIELNDYRPTYYDKSIVKGFNKKGKLVKADGTVRVIFETLTNAGMDTADEDGKNRRVVLPRGLRFKVVDVFLDSQSDHESIYRVQMVEVDRSENDMTESRDPFYPPERLVG